MPSGVLSSEVLDSREKLKSLPTNTSLPTKLRDYQSNLQDTEPNKEIRTTCQQTSNTVVKHSKKAARAKPKRNTLKLEEKSLPFKSKGRRKWASNPGEINLRKRVVSSLGNLRHPVTVDYKF